MKNPGVVFMQNVAISLGLMCVAKSIHDWFEKSEKKGRQK